MMTALCERVSFNYSNVERVCCVVRDKNLKFIFLLQQILPLTMS
jgi:hypothetical protein